MILSIEFSQSGGEMSAMQSLSGSIAFPKKRLILPDGFSEQNLKFGSQTYLIKVSLNYPN